MFNGAPVEALGDSIEEAMLCPTKPLAFAYLRSTGQWA